MINMNGIHSGFVYMTSLKNTLSIFSSLEIANERA